MKFEIKKSDDKKFDAGDLIVVDEYCRLIVFANNKYYAIDHQGKSCAEENDIENLVAIYIKKPGFEIIKSKNVIIRGMEE